MSTPRRKDLDSASYRKNRETFLTEWDSACHWCKRARATTIDHVIEQDRGADPTDQSNWVGACHKCNSRRGAEYLAKKRAATVQARTKAQNQTQKKENQNNFFEMVKKNEITDEEKFRLQNLSKKIAFKKFYESNTNTQ